MNAIEDEVKLRSAIALDCKNDDVTIVERLKGGVSHYTYHINVLGKDYTYRKIGEGGNLFVDRKTEYQTILAVASLEVNSKVLHFDVETGEKIQEFIKGSVLTSLNYNDYLNQVVQTLKTVHAFKTDKASDYGLINRLSLYESYTNKRTMKYQELKAFWIELYLQSYEQKEKVLCHNDAQRSNMVISDRLYLLDWEYAGYNAFYYDIASFGNVDFNDALKLLDAYLGRKATSEEQNHVRFYRMFQTLQWHQVALYKHGIGLGEKIGVDFMGLAVKYLNIAESFLPFLKG